MRTKILSTIFSSCNFLRKSKREDPGFVVTFVLPVRERGSLFVHYLMETTRLPYIPKKGMTHPTYNTGLTLEIGDQPTFEWNIEDTGRVISEFPHHTPDFTIFFREIEIEKDAWEAWVEKFSRNMPGWNEERRVSRIIHDLKQEKMKRLPMGLC